MATEIERKFLVKQAEWRVIVDTLDRPAGARYRQGYISTDKERTVRVRAVFPESGAKQQGYITIKGRTVGASRLEYEYEIPIQDAEELLDLLCLRPLIEKRRYKIETDDLTWEVDEFMGENAGLLIAEVELNDAEQPFTRPAWVGQEVTGDPRYFNANLVANPFTQWERVRSGNQD
jgi:adenylate cyclase